MERHFLECEKCQGIWSTAADCCGADPVAVIPR